MYECTNTYTQIHTESEMEIVLSRFQELIKINRFDITLENNAHRFPVLA